MKRIEVTPRRRKRRAPRCIALLEVRFDLYVVLLWNLRCEVRMGALT